VSWSGGSTRTLFSCGPSPPSRLTQLVLNFLLILAFLFPNCEFVAGHKLILKLFFLFHYILLDLSLYFAPFQGSNAIQKDLCLWPGQTLQDSSRRSFSLPPPHLTLLTKFWSHKVPCNSGDKPGEAESPVHVLNKTLSLATVSDSCAHYHEKSTRPVEEFTMQVPANSMYRTLFKNESQELINLQPVCKPCISCRIFYFLVIFWYYWVPFWHISGILASMVLLPTSPQVHAIGP